jgi:hypothetical protein
MPTSIESTTAEKRQTWVHTTADPTGQAVEWAVSTTGADPGTWVAGSWVAGSAGTFVDGQGLTRWRAITQSPLMGGGQALAIAGGTTVYLWVRWRIGTEVIVRLVEVFQIR